MYLWRFQDILTKRTFMVRARDAVAAIHYVEQKESGVFDCLAQYADEEPLGEPLAVFEPGYNPPMNGHMT